MLDDLTKTIKAQLHERATSPLMGAFALSWAVWNYKFIALLLSSLPVLEKFTYIDKTLYPTWEDRWLLCGFYPLLSTIVLIFVYPYPAKFVYGWWRYRQKDLKLIQQKIDDETPLTKEEAKEIRTEAFKKTNELEMRLQQKEQEIGRLRAENDDLWQKTTALGKIQEKTPDFVEAYKNAKESKSDKGIPSKGTNSQVVLTPDQIQFLAQLGKINAGEGTNAARFLNSLGGKTISQHYNRDILQKHGYIQESAFSGDLSLTSAGRAYLVENSHSI
jgi:hypothetical protein